MHRTIQRLGGVLKELESKIIRDCIYASNEDIQFLRHSRKSIVALDDELLGNITASLLAKNTAQRGIISWLNSGVSRDIRPEPIHLRQTLQYLIENAKFEMTGHDVFDIFAAPNDSTRYALIESRLHETIRGRGDRQEILIEQGELDTEKMKSLWQQFFPDEPYGATSTADKVLHSSVNDIATVAKKVFVDILKSRMYATNSAGELIFALASENMYHYLFLLAFVRLNRRIYLLQNSTTQAGASCRSRKLYSTILANLSRGYISIYSKNLKEN